MSVAKILFTDITTYFSMVPSMICFVLHIEVDIDLVTKTILALLGLASGIYTFLNARLQSKVLNKQLKNLSSHEEEKDE